MQVLKRAFSMLNRFFSDETTYYAASLSFFTIFSILPMITLFIAIFSYLPEFNQYVDTLSDYLFDMINPMRTQQVSDSLQGYISNAGKLGPLGLVYMAFVFVMFLKNYETIVNKIHQTKRKPLYASFFVYLVYFIVLPGVFIFLNLMKSFYDNPFLNGIVLFLFAWFVFYSLFKVSINKATTHKSTLIASLLTLIVLSISKEGFVYYVAYNNTYATIYGSLSILLFTFFWIYISWIIYLYGIKMCFWLDKQHPKTQI